MWTNKINPVLWIIFNLLVTSSPQLFWWTGVLQSGFSDNFPIFGSLISACQTDSKHCVISTRKVEGFWNAISNISWDTMNMFAYLRHCTFAVILSKLRSKIKSRNSRKLLHIALCHRLVCITFNTTGRGLMTP